MKPFKPSSKIFLLTVPRRYFFCTSFVDHLCFFVSCVSYAFESVHCCLVVTCWERADLLALVGDVYCIFVTFPCGILGQVWYLIVSFPDLCLLSYFERSTDQYHDIIDNTYSLDHTHTLVQCIALKIFAEYNPIHGGKYQLTRKRVMGNMYWMTLFNHHVS